MFYMRYDGDCVKNYFHKNRPAFGGHPNARPTAKTQCTTGYRKIKGMRKNATGTPHETANANDGGNRF